MITVIVGPAFLGSLSDLGDPGAAAFRAADALITPLPFREGSPTRYLGS